MKYGPMIRADVIADEYVNLNVLFADSAPFPFNLFAFLRREPGEEIVKVCIVVVKPVILTTKAGQQAGFLE